MGTVTNAKGGYTAIPKGEGSHIMTNLDLLTYMTQYTTREAAERNVGHIMEDFSLFCEMHGKSCEDAGAVLDFLVEPAMGHWRLNVK